jgi:hypothetical protein
VFWDRRQWCGIGAGNWSLRATCGKAQDLLGENAFIYLSNQYLVSPFLRELERGTSDYKRKKPQTRWIIKNKMLVSISTALMNNYMNTKSRKMKDKLAGVMQKIFFYL